ncbi:MAG TPA: hypothetical protein VHX43_18555 [Xanthobacteraceae bacterium]|jgi:hypothetical protein|nr:hypothetical protein [Xanthobacteraceae bacterium]
MLHYTYAPLARTVELMPRVLDRTPTMLCVSCGDTMKHSRTIEKIGVRPEQFIFICPSCQGVDSREASRLV